jgi:hypothetical protein
MAGELIPVPKSIYLCDEFLVDSPSVKINVLGVFDSFRPKGSTAPYELGRLCVVSQLVGGIGDTPINVEVTDSDTGELIFSSATNFIRFPNRHTTVYFCLRFRNCRFPRAGVYLIELYARGQFLDDRRFRVIVPEGPTHGSNGSTT